MMWTRWVLLIAALLAMSICAWADSDSDVANAPWEESLLRGVRWLLSQQQSDGRWRSETYGVMRCGVGNTALIVAALTEIEGEVPEEIREKVKAARGRGVEFLTRYRHASGFVYSPEGITDFPVYATALLLKSLRRHERAEDQLKSRLGVALRGAQRVKGNGFSLDDQNYGGWGMLDVADDAGVNPATVSTTSFVLEALAASGELTEEAREGALIFLSRCQREDGGFCFTPRETDPLNKAGLVADENDEVRARSYLSATCDGWIALRACGMEMDDEKVVTATRWLEMQRTHREGLPVEEREILAGLRFYEGARLAKLAKKSPEGSAVRVEWKRIAEQLVRDQSEPGFWVNGSVTMREDDPLIATGLGVWLLNTGLHSR